MNEGELFADFCLGGTPIHNCLYRVIDSDTRLYFDPHWEGNGFRFVLLRFVSCGAAGGVDWWSDPTLRVDAVFSGIAYFDGVRHVWAQDDGYIYYPDVTALSVAFDILRDLEDEHCSNPIRAGD